MKRRHHMVLTMERSAASDVECRDHMVVTMERGAASVTVQQEGQNEPQCYSAVNLKQLCICTDKRSIYMINTPGIPDDPTIHHSKKGAMNK